MYQRIGTQLYCKTTQMAIAEFTCLDYQADELVEEANAGIDYLHGDTEEEEFKSQVRAILWNREINQEEKLIKLGELV